MEKEFVTYELALRMKTLGFDRPCFAFYQIEYNEDIPVMVDDDNQYRISGFRTCKNSEIPAHYTTTPTWQSAFRWFREKYNLISSINTIIYGCPLNEQEFHYKIITNTGVGSYGQFETYEEAELACLKKLIEIVEGIEK
jgi:hypothetical protein